MSQRSSVRELVFLMAHEQGMMQEWAFINLLAAADHRSQAINCSVVSRGV